MGGLEFTRNQKLALIAIIGLIVIGVSVKMARNSNSARYQGVVLKEAGGDGVGVTTSDSDPMQASATGSVGNVVFQVAGWVKSPDVYTLPAGSRVIDGINAAGGAKSGADLQSLNLAAKIEDGQKIVVMCLPQAAPPASAGRAPTATASASTTAKSTSKASSSGGKLHNPGDGTVNINTADAAELQRLPGVGPSTADTILEYRRQIGHFSSADQLDDVKGIGPKKLEKMRPFVSL